MGLRADFSMVRRDTGRTPLLTAASQGHYMVCARLLEARADPMTSESESGSTGLHIAARQELSSTGSQEGNAPFFVAEAFLNAKANPAAPDRSGKTAIDYATEESDPDLLEFLESHSQITQRCPPGTSARIQRFQL